MRPLVSILIPCYNAARFLGQAVESALNQDWPHKEVIVVDDGSTDRSLEIARGYEPAGVRVIAQANRGASAARNAALAVARGDYVQYLDADDFLSPDKISAQVSLLEQSSPGCLALCATIHFQDRTDPEKGYRQDGWPLVDRDNPLNWLIELAGPDGNTEMVHPASWLSPSSVLAKAGPWDERLSLDDDGEYFCRVVLASNGLKRSLAGCSYYRRYVGPGNSLSGQSSTRHQRSGLLALDLRAEKILALADSERAKRGLARCYLDRAWCAYPGSLEVSELALRRARALGSKDDPPLPSRRSEALAKVVGWRWVRRVGLAYHGIKRRLLMPGSRLLPSFRS